MGDREGEQLELEGDGRLNRFDRLGLRRFSARDSVLAVLLLVGLLALFGGGSLLHDADEMQPGLERTVVKGVGKPVGAIADRLPFQDASRRATAFLSPDADLGGGAGGFSTVAAGAGGSGAGPAAGGEPLGVPPVSPDAFTASELGERAPPKLQLRTLLVTGDSLAMPLDAVLARRLVGDGVRVLREAHVGTGISKTALLDWGKLSHEQAARAADAVVVFIGANEGFPMDGPGGGQLDCCGADWAAVYATRVRTMMDAYRRAGAARVYWLTLPTPRDRDRQPIARTVNAAIDVAAQPWANQVRVLDMVGVFTPGERYEDAIDVDGTSTLVRESDGIHLNEAGAEVAADEVQRALGEDFEP
ncbi:GDSL-type esterase/lipase family protein [Conexibacter sp. CPCC 206217]|uniref:DUF459 domain-containing protein n=1 Tax=Conexibacter sp. CPCC 206217 TaxID=3064574 RepID=UPI002717AB74|nr:GDSL-type esterase/lipase family protein [Conexibacter sp. CPCC 206217]MDO8212367.1 GDSL-type esterase/lipase family protein [Conexibacter sp. CPCC 206217]